MINQPFATIALRNTFEVDDIICAKLNWDMGLFMFFKATDYDVENYSGRGLKYLVLLRKPQIIELPKSN